MWLGLSRHTAVGTSICGPGTLATRTYVTLDSLVTSRLLWILMVLVATLSHASPVKPPRFLKEPESQIVKHQTQVRLDCRVDPASATVRWYRDGHLLNIEQEKDLRLERGTLVIASFRHKPKEHSHVGVYQCEASTTAGTVLSRRATLERAVLGHFEEAVTDVYVNVTEGNVALIVCNPPHGHPPPATSFEVNNTLIDINSGRHMILPSGNLQIAKTRQSDQGTYQCIATNRVTGQPRRAPNHVHLKVIAPTVNTPPRIVKGPQTPVEVMKGANLTLECVAEGSPVPVVTWEKYGGQLPEGRFSQRLGNLIIHKVELLDQGTYICRASNSERGEVFSHTLVDVLEPPVIRTPPRDQIVKEGVTVTLHCEQQNNIRVRTDTQWLHNGRTVYLDSHKVITETTLTINNVQKADAGIYQCIAQNKLGMTYATSWLQVRSKGENITETDLAQTSNQMQDIAPDSLRPPSRPVIGVTPHNTTVVSGASTALSCTPQTVVPEMEIAWHKDGKPVIPTQTFSELSRKGATGGSAKTSSQEGAPQGSRYKVASSGSLQIFNVRAEDGGQFTCIIANSAGMATATAYLTVSVPVTESDHGGHDKTPLPTYPSLVSETPGGGTRNSSRTGLEEGGRGRGRQRGRGKKKKNKKKKGKKKKNDRDGEDVLVPPSRPEVDKLSDTSVMLTWEVPENEGLPITFFKVQYKDLGSRSSERRRQGWHTIDEDIPSNARRHEVSGLYPGSTYRFRVLAVYSNDDNKQGPNSKKFTLEVEPLGPLKAPLTGPVIVEARAKSSTAITVRWQNLPVDRSPIEGFKISYKPFHSNEEFQVATVPFASRRVHELINLRPHTDYTLRIRSYNNAGLSEFSNEVVCETLDIYDIPEKVDANLGTVIGENPHVRPAEGPQPTQRVEEYAPNPINTQSSSELLYTVLGIVLGVMMLLLIVFMGLCWWKQRQQRRMMAALNANMRKFEDPAKAIYVDSMRKKYGNSGGFVLNGITPNMTNGHGPPAGNGHIPNYTENRSPGENDLSGSKININVNPIENHEMVDSGHPTLDPEQFNEDGQPFSEFGPRDQDSDEDSQNRQSLAELRTTLQEALSSPPPPSKPNYGEITFGSIDRRSLHRNASAEPISNQNNYYTPSPHHQRHHSDHIYDPPDYSSIQAFLPEQSSPTLPHRNNNQSNRHSQDHHVVSIPRRQSHEHIPLTNMSNDRMSTFQRNKNIQQRALPSVPVEAEEVHDSGTLPGKNRRRRRRNKDQVVKEMATNTDMSSNDGTLDRPRRYPSSHEGPPHRGAETGKSPALPPLPQNDSANVALLGGARTSPYSHHPPNTSDYVDDHLPSYNSVLAYTDIPRVHDYPSQDEDEDEN